MLRHFISQKTCFHVLRINSGFEIHFLHSIEIDSIEIDIKDEIKAFLTWAFSLEIKNNNAVIFFFGRLTFKRGGTLGAILWAVTPNSGNEIQT